MKTPGGPHARGRRSQRAQLSLAGLGIELAAAVVGCTLLGLWIDRRYDTEPWGVLIAGLVGIVGGLYNFIREASRAVRNQQDGEG